MGPCQPNKKMALRQLSLGLVVNTDQTSLSLKQKQIHNLLNIKSGVTTAEISVYSKA